MSQKLLRTFGGLAFNNQEYGRFKEKFANINLDRVCKFSVIIALANAFLTFIPNLLVRLSFPAQQAQHSTGFLLLQGSVTLSMCIFYMVARKLTSESKLKYKVHTTNIFILVILLHAFGLSANTYQSGSPESIFLIASCALLVGLHLSTQRALVLLGGANILYLLGLYLLFRDITIFHTLLTHHLLFGTVFFLISRSINELKLRDLISLEKIEIQSAELKSSNRMLRMTEHTLNSINRNMHQGIFRFEKDSGFTYANDNFAQMLGYSSANELITDNAAKFMASRELEQISRKVNEQGFIEGVELEIEKKNKEKFWVQISCSVRRDENTAALLYEGSATDISHKRKALQEALENAAKLEQAEKIAHAGFYEISVSSGHITYSAGLCEILGTSQSGTLNLQEHLAFVHPEDQEKVRNTLLNAISKNQEFSLEYRVLNKGNVKYLNSRAGFIYDEKGNKIKILGTVQDVTNVRQSQEALEHSEAYIKAAFNNDRYGIYMIDPDLRLIDFNQECARRLKSWRNIELRKGMDVRETMLPATLQKLEPVLLQGFKGKQFTLEHKILEGTPQETWAELHISPVKDHQGRVLGLLMIGSDITKRKQNEELLENLSLVASHTDHAVMITDPKHRVEWVNEAFSRTMGFSLAEIKHCFPKDFLLSEKTDAAVLKQLNNCLRSGKSFKDEFLICDKKGQESWIQLAVNPVFNSQGALIKFVSVVTDLSKLKAYEQQLQIAKEKAEQSAESKEYFLSTVSHELRTPLNSVIGLTHHLLQNKPRKDQQEDLNILKFSAENLLSLINDILDLSKMEAGKINIHRAAFNLNEIISSLKQSFQHQAEAKGVAFKVFVSDRVPHALFGDSVRLIQILANLLSNAVKFTSSGSVQMFINVQLQEEDKCRLEVKVQDTGVGIAHDKLELIFEKFEQASNTSSNNTFGGTGLGLSISKQLIELQGGSISVASNVGQGTTFTFSIPYQVAQQHDLKEIALPPKADSQADLSRLQLLLVEDNLINQAVAGKFLKNWNISYTIAGNGKEAVQMAAERPFDLILMDLQMPLMNGYEATRQIRALRKFDYSQTPIIAITAAGTAGIEQKILAAGMTNMVLKPFKPQDLLHIIQQYCPFKKAAPKTVPVNKDKKAVVPFASHALDLSEVTKLAGEDATFIQDLLRLYIDQFNLLHQEALKSLEEQNILELRRIFHKMKPSIAMLKQENMHFLSQQLHILLHQEPADYESIHGLIFSFLDEMNKLKNLLQQELENKNFVLT